MVFHVAAFAAVVIATLPIPASAFPVDFGPAFRTRSIAVDGGTLSVTIGGTGPVVVLVHGLSEDSRMWKPLAQRLARRFTVIAPDLPGIGNSSIPSGHFDYFTAARDIRTSLHALGYTKAAFVGHDVGLIVAYAYAAKYPDEVTRLALMDLFIPGIPGWRDLYGFPSAWHFHFFGPTALALVAGRERIYFEHFWNDFATDAKHSLSRSDRAAYTQAYSRPGRMAAAFAYFAALPADAPAFEALGRRKLAIPVLAMGGDLAKPLVAQAHLIADDVAVASLKNAGHWLMEEQPKETMDALETFLEGR